MDAHGAMLAYGRHITHTVKYRDTCQFEQAQDWVSAPGRVDVVAIALIYKD